MAQQHAIAPGDHGEGVLDKIHGCVAQRRGLPGIGRNAGHAVNDASDLAIARPVHAPVNRLQHVAGTPALLAGQAGVRRHGATEQGFEQTLDGFEPVEAVEIERDQRGKGFAAGNACQPQEMENLPISGIVQEMDALFVGAGGGFLNDGEEIAIGGKYGRRGRQQHGAGVVLGAPEDGNFGRVERRADKEIATPSISGPGSSVP